MNDEKENNKPKKESRFKNFFQKFKKIKGIEIAIVVILLGVMLLVAFSSFRSIKKTSSQTSETSASSLDSYVASLESRLSSVLSQIEGAGEVSCMITLSNGFEQKLAYESSSSTTSGEKDGTQTSNSSSSESVVYVSKDGTKQPVVLYEEVPKISGVVVVATGAKNVNTKLDIIRAVRALLKVDASCIEVINHK